LTELARSDGTVPGRDLFGVSGDARTEPLRAIVRRTGTSWYPLVALGTLVAIDEWQGVAFAILAPDIAHTLGLSKAAVGALVSVKLLAIALATLPMAALVQKKPRRAMVAVSSAFVWAVVTLYSGFVTGVLALLLVLVVDGVSTGSVAAVHTPLLMDTYPPEARVRVLALHHVCDTVGHVLAPLLIAVMSSWLLFTWRGVFVTMGVASIVIAFVALRLRDPGMGHWDSGRIREQLRSGRAATERAALEEQTQLGFFEIVRRLMLIPTARRVLSGYAVFGVLIVPLNTFQAFFLEERWGMDAGARGLMATAGSIAGIAGLAAFGPFGERLFREDPARLVRFSSWTLVGAIGCIVVGAVAPVFGVMVVAFTLGGVLILAMSPALSVGLLSGIPAPMRAPASALGFIYLAGVGGVGGALLLGTIDRRFGVAGAMVAIALPGVLGALILRSAGKTIVADLDRTVAGIVQEEEVLAAADRGERPPLLDCRGIDFSYGSVQVLFDVDFTVDEGEMVALLGVNGAGKSTLLRVISGLGLPTAGAVRLQGVDITYIDAERRTRLGISQIPGGRAVFGPMTVAENLRMFAYSLGRSRQAVDGAIEAALSSFPRLAERLGQNAATLSGGEQQMLALCKARMLRPRLLLIDELSLGLAPVVVAQLLDLVREINADGTAVVLVEQSVNVALSLVDHAYFMEKGEIRFDGPARELLEREDLLRAVFLAGATAAKQ
jgi:ABC-type branched-subunit amino acid transport system ATPase component/sugar phosphate permease